MKSDTVNAVNILKTENLTCVICGNGTIYKSCERGVKPLLNLIDNDCDITGFCAADKVVGNGAAYLYVLLGVSEVYAGIISKPAKDTLDMHGITVFYDKITDEIRNRTNTGRCPMEVAVEGAFDAKDAMERIRNKLREINV